MLAHFARAALIAIAIAAPATASDLTARASARIPVHSAPRSWAPVIDRLNKNERVKLDYCTREAVWCHVIQLDGGPAGWVEGSWLVGSPAKVSATPSILSFDPLWPRGLVAGDKHHPHP